MMLNWLAGIIICGIILFVLYNVANAMYNWQKKITPNFLQNPM